MKPNLEIMSQLIQTVHQLRSPQGCPWDQAQTHQSLKGSFLEEAYEVLDAIDEISTKDDLKVPVIRNHFCEELGDVFLHILLQAEIASEVGAFNIFDIAQALNEKLVRRHPHVFGSGDGLSSSEDALKNWNQAKSKEKAARPDQSVLEGLPKGLPALQRATRLLEKIKYSRFDWQDLNGPLSKVEEELTELKAALQHRPTETLDRQSVESEMGDLLFSLCSLSAQLKIDPENALRNSLLRFETRFKYVESGLKSKGQSIEKGPQQENELELNQLWEEAKILEKIEIWGLTGGIAAGKSTVRQIFSDLGVPGFDADEIVKRLIEKNESIREAILQRFQTLHKPKLRALIFSDQQAKKDLENIIHPWIQAELYKKILSLSPKPERVIYEAPLLIETGKYKQLSGLIVVEAPREQRCQRLMKRDLLTEELAYKMIDSQLSDERRRKYAHFILQNSDKNLDSTPKDPLRLSISQWMLQKGWCLLK